MNGVDIIERIRPVLAEGIVLPACLYVGTHIESPALDSIRAAATYYYLRPRRNHPRTPPKTSKPYYQNRHQVRMVCRSQPKTGEIHVIAAFGLVTALYGEALSAS